MECPQPTLLEDEAVEAELAEAKVGDDDGGGGGGGEDEKEEPTFLFSVKFFLSLLGLSASSLANMIVVKMIYDCKRLIFSRFRHMSCKRSFDELMLFDKPINPDV